MAARKKRRSSRRRASRSSNSGYPGWAYGTFGLAVGLSVAAAVWFSDRRPDPEPVPLAQQPASLESALDRNNEAGSKPAAAEPAPAAAKKAASTFTKCCPILKLSCLKRTRMSAGT